MVNQYLEHSKEILTSPYTSVKSGNKSIELISKFGHQNEYDLREGFPLLTTKKLRIDSIAHELIWFMSGETNIKYLEDNGVSIWSRDAFNHNLDSMVSKKLFPEDIIKYTDDWNKALEEYTQRIKTEPEFAARWGDLGPVYGAQWRHWKYFDEGTREFREVDQFERLFEKLQKDPTNKKLIVSAWNPADMSKMALEPCHILFQANAADGYLDLQMYQRSCDQFLGVPFNIASYAMLTTIIAQQADLEPRRFIHTFGDAHFYCSDGARAQWYKENLPELQKEIKFALWPEDYINIRNSINERAPIERDTNDNERKGKDRYDHVTAILQQLARKPREKPKLSITKKDFNALTIDDFSLKDYDPHQGIWRAMAV